MARSLSLIIIVVAFLRICQAISISSLLVENKVEPLGIDSVPRFSWVIASPTVNDVQKSYRLRVASGNEVIWDTFDVLSKKSYLVEYGGPPLASDTRYAYTVEVTTASGKTSASSTFTTGLLGSQDWGNSQWIGKPTSGPSDDLISAFQQANWIWTSEASPPDAPPGDRVFRKVYRAPNGQTPVSATILITADDQFVIYANGQLVGSSPTTPDIWKNAQFFTTSPSNNSISFAIRTTNLADVNTGGDGPAGLLVAARIGFSDGTSVIITSDSTWLSNKIVPENWSAENLDTSGWSAASLVAPYGQGPWSNQVVIPTSTSSTSPELSFSDSEWIWSSDATTSSAPAETRAFRKTFAASQGKTLASALVLLTVDDGFQLYVNGNLTGASPNETDVWKAAQKFIVPVSGTSVLFAVRAINLPDVNTNGPSPAGLLSAIQVTYTDGSTDVVRSDTSWKVSSDIPPEFESPSFDDSSWPSATSLGAYGVSPWGTQVSISQSLEEHPAPLLRKELTISKPISFARMYYAAGGYASITINGASASDRVLTPGFTKYDTEMQYVSIDITSRLQENKNVVGIELGRSHFGVTQGNVWNWDQAPWHGEPRVRAVISIGFEDGSLDRIVTDGTWQVKEGPTRLDDIFGGENFDASYIQHGFDTPGFNATGWNYAAIMSSPTNVLVSQLQPPTRIMQTLTPVNITQPVPGIFVAHFERNIAGWIRLTATGPAKTLITIHFGEKLNPDGTVIYQDTQHYYQNNFQTDRFWLAGTGHPESFEPKFSYKGFQYVQIEGWPSSSAPPSLSDVQGKVVHDDLAPRGDFSCSSDLLNKMHRAEVFTLLNNVQSIPTDCPTFEKNGWSGDAMLGTEMFLLNLDSQDLLSKYVRDLDESRPNGSGPPAVIAPDSGWGANNHAPTWHSAFILIPWWIYQYRGDVRVLQDHYSSMKDYVEFELGRSPNFIADTSLGDWDTPETSPLGGNPPEDSRVSATAYLYHMLDTMSQVATTLNNTVDASNFSSQASNVKNAFNALFLSNATGYYVGSGDSGYRQTHNILSLAFGLVPNTSIQTVADSIKQDVLTRGTHLNTGALGTKYLLPVLAENGHEDIAWALAEQTSFPSWGYWIDNGATTMWEHWLLTARSHDHLFLGTFEDYLYKTLGGIQMTSVAYETVTISLSAVTSTPLVFLNVWTMTPFGNLSLEWTKREDNETEVQIKVPVGVTAKVVSPASVNMTKEGENDMIIGSGHHNFNIKLN